MKIKTIDVNAKEWFDKANGNSYFSADVIVNYGMKSAKAYSLPFQYGYGDNYQDVAMEYLVEHKVIKDATEHDRLWSYCRPRNIILRTSKQENCLKRELYKRT